MIGTTVPIHDLTQADIERMHALLDAHFEGVSHEQFERDLSDKSAAVLLRDREGVLRGFSTLDAYRSTVTTEPLGVVCSGDTIVEPSCRGSAALARTWIHAARSMTAELACARSVWLLICSGFRTYRFLPVFWREFTPKASGAPATDAFLLRKLAAERYGPAFDPSTGIVRLSQPQRLREDAAEIPAGRESDPDVRHFLRLNPGHAAGDELACLCDLRDENLTPAGRRMVFGAAMECAR